MRCAATFTSRRSAAKRAWRRIRSRRSCRTTPVIYGSARRPACNATTAMAFARSRPPAAIPRRPARRPVSALIEDANGTIWIGTGGTGVEKLDASRGTIERVPIAKDAPPELATCARSRSIPATASGSAPTPGSRTSMRKARSFERRCPLPHGEGRIARMHQIRRGEDGTLWIASSLGLFRLPHARRRARARRRRSARRRGHALDRSRASPLCRQLRWALSHRRAPRRGASGRRKARTRSRRSPRTHADGSGSQYRTKASSRFDPSTATRRGIVPNAICRARCRAR